jgi:hypothetical protein
MIVASLCLLNSAYANPFNPTYWNPNTAPFRTDSFYVGAGVGSAAMDYHTIILQPNPIIDSKFYGSGVLGNLQAGYQADFGCYTMSLEGFANITSQRTSPFTIYGPTGSSRNMQFVNDWNAGVSVLPGYLLNEFLVAYLRLGYVNSHYKINISGAAPSAQFTKNNSGGEIGLGGEVWFPMLKNFSVRGEYDSIIAPRWDGIGSFSCTGGACHSNANVDIINNMFQINFIYHIV